jgi:hypothetical protein
MMKRKEQILAKFSGLALSVLWSCAADEPKPITETGFHETIPGAFNNFVAIEQPCGSLGDSGLECSYLYDDQGRDIETNCPGLYRIQTSYDDQPLTRTTQIDAAADGRDQTETEVYSLHEGLVDSVVRTRSYESGSPDTTTFTYIRDPSQRLTNIEISGYVTADRSYFYDDEGFVTRMDYVGDAGAGTRSRSHHWDYIWQNDRLSEAWLVTDDGSDQIYRYFYDQDGVTVGWERTDSDGTVSRTDYDYDCSEDS